MSLKKEGKVLPKIFLADLERDIAARIAQALRTDFPNIKAAANTMALQTEISMETLKKWYNGRNAPSAANLIVLGRGSQAVRHVLAELVDGVLNMGKFQTQVLNSMRVKVYKVTIYDVSTDENRISRRMATEAGAARMRGEIIPETETLINSDQLEYGEEWTKPDFVPPSR